MFIKIPDKKIVALNLNASDSVEIYEHRDKFVLRLSKQFEPPITVKTTIQTYSTYDQAFDAFQRMMDALASGEQVWSP